MKKLKLFPKTFLYVFSLMAAISVISHALFYFMMPIVYTNQKETKFQDAQEQLIKALKDAPPDNIESMVPRYALQYQMSVFLYCDGETYNLTVDSTSQAVSGHSLQKTVTSDWSVPDNGIDLSYLENDFYTKTDAAFYSGTHFDMAGGKPCYLVLSATLQPVNEAKEAVIVFLPFTLLLSLLLSAISALLYSRTIAGPLSKISEMTARMKALDPWAVCRAETQDEIGTLSENVNALYQSLLTTIDNLQKENARVSQAETAKVDFLRAASHELKTPVTALRGMLDNMIMGIGRYRDWETYLPMCRDMVKKFGVMIQEILDASKLSFSFEQETAVEVSMETFLEKVLSPYALIAKSKGVGLDTDFSAGFSASFPANAMEKALSNILSNAVKYTKPPGKLRVYFKDRTVVFENECEPVPSNLLPHIFEPFYRPDFSRSRNQDSENPDGGNGLGLYITAKILDTLSYGYSFEPFEGLDEKTHGGMRFTIFF